MQHTNPIQQKQNDPHKTTIAERYNSFCASQEGKEFLWYSISFISLVGSIMPIALMAMSFTPWFYPFIGISMSLFFGNVLSVIGRASIKFIISFYLFTVGVNIGVPLLALLILKIFA
ncbi:MAG: hypothetical protein AAF705_08745 [Bacteroidota bacterium]